MHDGGSVARPARLVPPRFAHPPETGVRGPAHRYTFGRVLPWQAISRPGIGASVRTKPPVVPGFRRFPKFNPGSTDQNRHHAQVMQPGLGFQVGQSGREHTNRIGRLQCDSPVFFANWRTLCREHVGPIPDTKFLTVAANAFLGANARRRPGQRPRRATLSVPTYGCIAHVSVWAIHAPNPTEITVSRILGLYRQPAV